MREKLQSTGDFIPDLCSMHAVFVIIIVGELLALVIVVVGTGLQAFDWLHFGSVSMIVQWILLSSVAGLCPLRPWFRRQPLWVAGVVSYLLVLMVTALISLFAQFMQSTEGAVSWFSLLEHIFISAVFSGVALRYFYIQQQLRNQQQAELLARIQALQSRIRPHFLFNCMNSIASLIAFSPERAEKMVVDLSHLFRASLQEPGLVPLHQELELCRRFTEIETLRLGERLRVQWQLPEGDEWHEIPVPSFLFQPLVENAIYHGIQPIPEGGSVSIDLRVDHALVVFVIRNPVLGREVAVQGSGNGMALENIRNRLSAHYGHAASIQIKQEGNTFCVELKYPVISP